RNAEGPVRGARGILRAAKRLLRAHRTPRSGHDPRSCRPTSGRPRDGAAGGAPGGSTMAKSILMVEDDGDARMIFRTILEYEGYAVSELTAGSGAQAAVLAGRPDLVLLDIGLPDVSGWEVAARLRNDPETGNVKILVVTAEDPADGAERRAA